MRCRINQCNRTNARDRTDRGSEIGPSFSNTVHGETARKPRLAIHNGPNVQRLEGERDIDA